MSIAKNGFNWVATASAVASIVAPTLLVTCQSPAVSTASSSITTSSSNDASAGGNSVEVLLTTPEPTFITTQANETALKLTYFFVALVLFTIPAIFSCAFFFTRHHRRLAAVRALQESKSRGANKDDAEGNIAEGTGGTTALNVSSTVTGKSGGSQQGFRIFDVSYTPPDKSILASHEIYGKPPFREDLAVMTELELGARPTQPDDGGEADGFGARGNGGTKVLGGFGAKSNLMAGGDLDDDDLNPSSNSQLGRSGRSKSLFNDDENPLVAGEDQEENNENSSSQIESPKTWGKNKGGKKKKAEW